MITIALSHIPTHTLAEILRHAEAGNVKVDYLITGILMDVFKGVDVRVKLADTIAAAYAPGGVFYDPRAERHTDDEPCYGDQPDQPFPSTTREYQAPGEERVEHRRPWGNTAPDHRNDVVEAIHERRTMGKPDPVVTIPKSEKGWSQDPAEVERQRLETLRLAELQMGGSQMGNALLRASSAVTVDGVAAANLVAADVMSGVLGVAAVLGIPADDEAITAVRDAADAAIDTARQQASSDDLKAILKGSNHDPEDKLVPGDELTYLSWLDEAGKTIRAYEPGKAFKARDFTPDGASPVQSRVFGRKLLQFLTKHKLFKSKHVEQGVVVYIRS